MKAPASNKFSHCKNITGTSSCTGPGAKQIEPDRFFLSLFDPIQFANVSIIAAALRPVEQRSTFSTGLRRVCCRDLTITSFKVVDQQLLILNLFFFFFFCTCVTCTKTCCSYMI